MSAAVPPGYHTVTPRVFVEDPETLVEFLRAVFDATGEVRPGAPAEVRLGSSVVMVSSTEEREAFPAFLYVYVEDVDATWRRATASGATTVEAPRDTPYGDRRATVRGPFGNVFQIAQRLESLQDL